MKLVHKIIFFRYQINYKYTRDGQNSMFIHNQIISTQWIEIIELLE